jgi:hypothetical protein
MKDRGSGSGTRGGCPMSGGGTAAGLVLRQGICGSSSAGSPPSTRKGLPDGLSDCGLVCSWSRSLFGAYGS